MKAPSPAFSLYPKDLFGDIQCAAMTHAEFGMYIRLLGHAWLDGSIPANPVLLQRILKVSPKTFKAAWPTIAPCFTEAGDRLLQGRLEAERTRQKERAIINAERGKKGGRPRGGRRPYLPQENHEPRFREGTGAHQDRPTNGASPVVTPSDESRKLSPSYDERKPGESLPFPSPFLPPQENPEPDDNPHDNLVDLHATAVAKLMGSLAVASEALGIAGADILALPSVRPPRGTPITNPSGVAVTANGVELILVTDDKVRGLIASKRGDAIAAAMSGKAPSIFDQPAIQEARVA